MEKKSVLLVILIMLTAMISLSIHVYISQNFQPPEFQLKTTTHFIQFIGYLIRWCTVLGALMIFIFSQKTWENIPLFYRVILFALLIMALTEQLLRTTIMDILIGNPWILSVFWMVPTYIGYLTLSL